VGEGFRIIPKLEQPEMFDAVEEVLKDEGTICIFPEGGSHDQTTILPLKAGVCIMALGTMAKYGIPVSIQCVGLNYYEGYKFRSNAAINFGPTYTIPMELAEQYKVDRRGAIATLLEEI
jgi:glycerol-3-phosphate O-acyltransferase/dihydroxyacetone phosphate acyltransferase